MRWIVERTADYQSAIQPVGATSQGRGEISATVVAQIGNLPYRRLAIGDALDCRTHSGLPIRDTASRRYVAGPRRNKRQRCSADWQSAVSPIGNRRRVGLSDAQRIANPRY